jgi:two-component system sensor histidine kinase ChvG
MRRAMSRLWIRLLAFNLLLVFLPVAGVLFLDTYEDHLLRAQERTMGQEGRLLAAALEAHGTVDDGFAESVLVQLGQRPLARLRVVDHDGRVVADSAALGPRRDTDATAPEPGDQPRSGWLYRVGSFPFRLYRSLAQPAADDLDRPPERGEPAGWPEVQDALDGRYGATTRISDGDRRLVNLYIAIPVRTDDAVTGAVLVSQSTARILSALHDVRLDVLKVFLASLAAAIVLSLVVATTIARPLTRLQRHAGAILDRRGRLKGVFAPTRRADEIGDLERALAELTRRLEQHLAFIESFASDVAHEFRNPLAAIRTATEMALDVDDDAQRRRFLEMIGRDVARMERLLSEAREVSRIDARLDEEERVLVAVDELLSTLIESFRLRSGEHGPQFVLALADHRVEVSASPDRLTQAFENLVANAVSFSPAGGTVTVTVRRHTSSAVVTVADDGPGIPEEHRDRIFDRFFSYRPAGDPDDGHSGLGLSVVLAIVEGYGGVVRAEERHGGGAKMVVELPIAAP